MPIIFIPQEQRGKNLAAALKYGNEIVACLPQDYQVYADTPDTVTRIQETLRIMEPDDYLLLIGDPILIGLTCAVAFQRQGCVKVLKWDAQTRSYVPVTLEVY